MGTVGTVMPILWQSLLTGKPGKGGLQGGAQKLAALLHVWTFCCRKLKYISYPGMQLACGQGMCSSTGAEISGKTPGYKIVIFYKINQIA